MENVEEVKKTYPTPADKDGWAYLDEASEALKIETRADEDGNIFKRVTLTKGRMAIVRELTGKEMSTVKTMAGKNVDRLMSAAVAAAASVTDAAGKPVKFVMEDLPNWKAQDTNRLEVATQQLNF